MRDRFLKPSDSGRSMALGARDPRNRRDAAATVQVSPAIQQLREPGPGASTEELRAFIGQLLNALKERS